MGEDWHRGGRTTSRWGQLGVRGCEGGWAVVSCTDAGGRCMCVVGKQVTWSTPPQVPGFRDTNVLSFHLMCCCRCDRHWWPLVHGS